MPTQQQDPTNPEAAVDASAVTPSKPENETFDVLLAKMEPSVQAAFAAHTQGLRSALEAERNQRKETEAQLRTLAKTAEAANETKLTELANKLAEATRRASFLEAATASGVRPERIKAAQALAQTEGWIAEDGAADWDKLKGTYPELFAATAAPEKPAALAPTNPGTPQRLTREAIERMTPAEINQNWPAVQAALAASGGKA